MSRIVLHLFAPVICQRSKQIVSGFLGAFCLHEFEHARGFWGGVGHIVMIFI
jgi:hypothetical protein